jgi:hypothetical protein
MAVAVLAMATLLVGVSGVAAASGGTKVPAAVVQQPAYWTALKALLDKNPSLTRNVTVEGAVRLYTYTAASGMSFVLAEPSGHASLSVKPNLGIVQCASWSFCLRLDRTDQGAIATGAAAGIAAAACVLGGPPTCIAVSVAVGVAAFYIAANGFCSRQLQIEIFPNPGAWPKCV